MEECSFKVLGGKVFECRIKKIEKMKINVGTLNETKLTGVREVVGQCPDLFPQPEIIPLNVGQPLYGHPQNLNETIQGAMNRAFAAFHDCVYSIGLEGALMAVPHTLEGKMEVAVCAIYDGKEFYIGLGSAFEWPPAVTKMIECGQTDASTAFRQLGHTTEEKLGAQPGGMIGFLTRGMITREYQTKSSIITALVRLLNKEKYSKD